MTRFLRSQLRGILSLLLFTADTFMVTVPFYAVAFLKWIVPVDSWRLTCSWLLHRIADVWIYFLKIGRASCRERV